AAWPVIKLIDYIAKGVEIATAATPFVMGIVIAVVMGLILTLPTSSAAMWITIAMTAPTSDAMLIAGGASVVGCAAHMVGFAVASFRENKWGGLIAQGLGTSMLQIPNLMKNPKILIPQIVSSAVVGPLSTTVFMLRCNAAGGGMGTSGLVGVFGTIAASSGKIPDWQMWLGIALLMFVIPAIISLAVSELLRKKNWIKPSDQKIEGIGK
ncbi:MAG TPA: PTS sugar transporter subunit IIC, partial [Eubacteriales bacterium]|nr:PTS sugar transporter subunit IIC [Eubacteriales bacterium]